MDRRTLAEIQQILDEIDRLKGRLASLLTEDGMTDPSPEIDRIIGGIRDKAIDTAVRQCAAALARVNFEDRNYRVRRVIDGDTFEADPPDELRRWLLDVHVRLYGVDAPESSTEQGPIYTDLLTHLLSLDEGRIHIVWERERRDTEYGGFPTTSFERGVGNVFVDLGERALLYVNGVMASLPDVRIERGANRLIRMARHARHWPTPFWRHVRHHWHRHYPWPWFFVRPYTPEGLRRVLDLPDVRGRIRESFRWPPGFACVVPHSFVNSENSTAEEVRGFMMEHIRRCSCPECVDFGESVVSQWFSLVHEENATPFDLILLLAYAYSHELPEDVPSV
jgi:hypothetical protein